MELIFKAGERLAPGWMPYVYLAVFIVLLAGTFIRFWIVTREMLKANKDLGDRVTAAEARIDDLESDRDKHDERIKATKELLDTILAEVLATPQKIADAINSAASAVRR